MKLLHKEIIGLPVYTKSGVFLGTVRFLEIDTAHQSICYYGVGERNPLRWLFQKKLIIHRSFVISLTVRKMTVVDNVVKQRDVAELSQKKHEKNLTEEKLPTLPSNQL
ncbi:MAG TPA: PRC-barrel domain-containing protein [Patescibacteria group bacterium]|nr:PRC-barrel domain-containing protein [Patescibacteria group bacterium]